MSTTIEVFELRALVPVEERASFTAAADGLETGTTHVSRIVSRLENKLGAQLLRRSAHRLAQLTGSMSPSWVVTFTSALQEYSRTWKRRKRPLQR